LALDLVVDEEGLGTGPDRGPVVSMMMA